MDMDDAIRRYKAGTSMKQLADELSFADQRLRDHERLERDRREAGLRTDLERYESGEATRD